MVIIARAVPMALIVILAGAAPAVSAGFSAATTATTATTATPVFSPKAGTYAAAQSVRITDATAGATIYYTTNGTTPTTASTPYTAPIKVAADETLEAIAVATGDSDSAVASAAYTILAATPVFSLKAGTYVGPSSLTLSDKTAGAVIYYTTNGSTPTTTSTKYTVPLAVDRTETVKALAVAKGYGNSAVASAAYTVETEPPVLSPKPGTFVGPQRVTLSDATAAAAIYYTTNGTAPTVNSAKYGGPITVALTETLRAIAIASGDAASTVTSGTYTIDAAAPVFSPAGGTYPAPQNVSITDSTAGAAIYYTTNGSTPTTNSARYSAPIKVGVNETLKAIAAVKGDGDSSVASADYTIVTPAPVLSPKAGTYSAAQIVTISDAIAGAAIYYTTNGSTPTASSTKYGGPITVAGTETVKAIAIASGDSPSAVTSGTYTIAVATPVFSPAGGTYSAPQGVTIADATAGATIYYTTNGSTPTTASTPYTAPIAVSAKETIKAIAVKSGLANSAVASASYVIASLHYTEIVVHSFDSVDGDGYNPEYGLILGPGGNFYGLTDSGGANDADAGGAGTAFKITPDGVESVFYSFNSPVYGGDDIVFTPTHLMLGSDGNFYGTSSADVVFKITPDGAESTIYTFGDSGSDDGESPNVLIQGKDGNLYGTTAAGGASEDYGVVFKLTTSGEETILHSFAVGTADGWGPNGILQASDGSFYGTTFRGGTHDSGTVYKITPAGTETVLYSFGANGKDGATPLAGLVEGSDGNFYGTTYEGGAHNSGTVYKITPDGTETVLYSFSGSPDGAGPAAPLVEGADGNFYGTTSAGGAGGAGTVFQITPEGAEAIVWSFQSTSDTDGAGPAYAPVLFDADGNLWGTTSAGGAVTIPSGVDACPSGCGTVFEIMNVIAGAKAPRDAKR